MVSFLLIILERFVSPAFVDRCPGNNARMIDVSANRLHPFLVESLRILIAKFIRICHFTPDEETKLIGPIQEDRVLNFLMLAASIEAHLFRQLDVMFET